MSTVPDEQRVADDRQQWRAVRTYLNGHRHELARRAAALHRRLGPGGLVVPDGWVPSAPVPMESVELAWLGDGPPPVVRGTEPATAAVRPLRTADERYRRYSDAMAELARPQVFEDRPCYRLLEVAVGDGAARLGFGRASYFAIVDVCEPVAHELARDALEAEPSTPPGSRLAFRELVGDPADLARRAVVPAITVLTIRHSASDGPTFLLHRRDAGKVVHAGGMDQVIPVGVFQPSAPGPANERHDLDLLRSISREWSEELLGEPERAGGHDRPIDYDAWPFAASIRAASRDGRLRLHWLGIGIDPLSLAVDMLVVAVFDEPLFDTLFDRLVNSNAEGTVMGSNRPGEPVTGFPFSSDAVADIIRHRPLQAAGAAVLLLAAQHRTTILR